MEVSLTLSTGKPLPKLRKLKDLLSEEGEGGGEEEEGCNDTDTYTEGVQGYGRLDRKVIRWDNIAVAQAIDESHSNGYGHLGNNECDRNNECLDRGLGYGGLGGGDHDGMVIQRDIPTNVAHVVPIGNNRVVNGCFSNGHGELNCDFNSNGKYINGGLGYGCLGGSGNNDKVIRCDKSDNVAQVVAIEDNEVADGGCGHGQLGSNGYNSNEDCSDGGLGNKDYNSNDEFIGGGLGDGCFSGGSINNGKAIQCDYSVDVAHIVSIGNNEGVDGGLGNGAYNSDDEYIDTGLGYGRFGSGINNDNIIRFNNSDDVAHLVSIKDNEVIDGSYGHLGNSIYKSNDECTDGSLGYDHLGGSCYKSKVLQWDIPTNVAPVPIEQNEAVDRSLGNGDGDKDTEKDSGKDGGHGHGHLGICHNENLISRSSSMSRASFAIEGLRFINKKTGDRSHSWDIVEKRFHKLASTSFHTISRSDFAACIGMEDSAEFAGELFDALSRRKGLVKPESLTLDGLHDFWIQITDNSFHARVQIFFDLCDKDSDGRISEEEVKEIIMLSASSNKLSIFQEQAEEYAALIMDELDHEKVGYIELWQLESLFRAASEGFNSEAYQNYSQSLSAIQSRKRKICQGALIRDLWYLLQKHWRQLWILSLWVGVMVLLFTWKFLQYMYRADFQVLGYCVCTAKGAAETLKLNMALILFPVCRNTITWLRSTHLGSIIPFNDNIRFHKIVAGGVGVGLVMHAGSHLGCDFPRIVKANHEQYESVLAMDFGERQPSLMDIILTPEVLTGLFMTFCMLVAYVLASNSSRKNLLKLPWPFHRLTGFNAFWYSHHLFIIVYALLIFHSFYLFLSHSWMQKTTWMYLAVPLIVYAGERFLRVIRSRQYKVNVVKAALHPGNVVALYMTKPIGFKYKSGMYLFLQCPSISPFEWHPFSITSAPGDHYLSVHIRVAGDWTEEIRKVFKEALDCAKNKRDSDGLDGSPFEISYPKLCIDGPYGAPAQDYNKYDVILLIGLGIGATPFISILKDVMNHIKWAELNPESPLNSSYSMSSKSSNGCSLYSPSSSSPSSVNSPSPTRRRKLRTRGPNHAYFYWVTREQGSFEWFKGVMNEVAEKDQKSVVEMHNYLTSVYEERDARSSLIMLVQALYHAKSGVDIVSGTRVRTHFARPNWQKVFSKVSAASHYNAKIGVFYCGPSAVAKELASLCQRFSQGTATKFVFHQESF